MKAEEKALQLIGKFKALSKSPCDCLEYTCTCFYVDEYDARRMALICVDEQIDYIRNFTPLSWQVREAITNELEEVKQEINKL